MRTLVFSIKTTDEFKEHPKVSASTISRIFLAKSAVLLKRLEEGNIELIFVDELKVSE